jgi:multiple sugar transport system substrate-binding protein/lactose/L-arabinose transport system substrate-binding protein
MFDEESRRRQVLRWAALSAGVGLAGCSNDGSTTDGGEEDEETDTATPTATATATEAGKDDTPTATEQSTMAAPQVQFEFTFESGALTIAHGGGDTVQADRLRITSSDGNSVFWSEVGSSDVAAGSQLVIDGSTPGWNSPVASGETVTVEYVVDGQARATLGSTTVTTPTETEPQVASEITLWAYDDYAQAINEFTDRYSDRRDATVTIDSKTAISIENRMSSALESGSDAPACSIMDEEHAPLWIETGGLRDISNRLASFNLRDQFAGGTWPALSDGDATYGLPWTIEPMGFYFNREIIEELGIGFTSVETWDDMLFRLRDLPSDKYLFSVPAENPSLLWRRMVRQQGGNPVTEDGDINLNSPESRQTLETLQTLYTRGHIEFIEWYSADWYNSFRDERHVGTFGGPRLMQRLSSNLSLSAGDWRILQPPSFGDGGSRATAWKATSLVIPSQVSDGEAERAWDYMRYTLANRARQGQMYEDYNLFPAFEDAYDSDAMEVRRDFLGGQSPGDGFYNTLAQNISGYRFTTDNEAIETAIDDNVEGAIEGASVNQALSDASQQAASETGRDIR